MLDLSEVCSGINSYTAVSGIYIPGQQYFKNILCNWVIENNVDNIYLITTVNFLTDYSQYFMNFIVDF